MAALQGRIDEFRKALFPGKNASGTTLALPPTVKKDVFLNALLEMPTTKGQRRSPLEWAGATALHVAILAALIIVPLYTTGTIQLNRYEETPLVAPPPPPPPAPAAAAVAPQVTHPHAQLAYKLLTMPRSIPRKISENGPAAPPDLGTVAGAIPSGVIGGELGGVVGGVLGGTAPAPTAPPPPRPVHRIVRAGSGIQPPRQTYSVDPEYPPLARQGRIAGTVVVDAVIDERGNVVQARALSGHPILIPAALKAVLQWKYEPTSLNGQPISVVLKVFVNFR